MLQRDEPSLSDQQALQRAQLALRSIDEHLSRLLTEQLPEVAAMAEDLQRIRAVVLAKHRQLEIARAGA